MDPIVIGICIVGLGLTLSLFTLGSSKMSSYLHNAKTAHLSGTNKDVRRVLIVTAHPDDECMFFGPVILHFTQKENALVYLLCLSYGDNDGGGNMRMSELWYSCSILGIPSENIILYKCEDLPDNPLVMWPTYHTGQIISHNIHSLDINMVITFDHRGISGHVNHSAINNAMEYLIEEEEMPQDCETFYLDSVNILRKYSSILDVFLSFVFSSYAFTVSYKDIFLIQATLLWAPLGKIKNDNHRMDVRSSLVFFIAVIVETLQILRGYKKNTPITPNVSADAFHLEKQSVALLGCWVTLNIHVL